MSNFGCIITRKPLELGLLYIPKENANLLPSTDSPAKIMALLDEDNKEIELTYNPKYRRVHGLAAFYGKHDAQIGDLVEIKVLDPLKKYRLRFKKSPVPSELARPTVKKPESFPLVGPPINFHGLIYASVNENGVIFLFSKVAEDLGIIIEGIQVGFPDAFGKRYEKGKGYPITIEFEYQSSDYLGHGHREEGCDSIVCWEHDWKECPTYVIELESPIRDARAKLLYSLSK